MYHRTIWRSIVEYKMNAVIKILILSDFIIWSVSNLIGPIFAIFIIDFIPGATLEAVGISAALYLIFKSIFEIPVGIWLDKKRGEKDDLYTAVVGSVLISGIFFFYPHINSVWQLYMLQCLLGVAAAISYPGWYGIFTRHIDKKKEAFEWSVYDVALGSGMAGAAAIGAFMADFWGFDIVFYVSGFFTFIGALTLLVIKGQVYKK